MITDLNPIKPFELMDDNLKYYNMYFGDLDNNTRCYVAPERWRSPDQQDEVLKKLSPSMDVFSVGCVIAEILMDGLPLFSLSKLQQYRKGNYDPSNELVKYIPDQTMVKLILKMIDRDPLKRPTAVQCLQDWNLDVFPQSFSKVLFHIGASFFRQSQLYSDNKISLIRYHVNTIFETCLGRFK